jgi:hypothetical protein
MAHRGCILLAVAAVFAAAPSVAFAGAGFVVPSGNTTCGLLTSKQAAGGGAGLYCQSSYVKVSPEDAMGAAKLLHHGKGRKLSIGNDDALYIGGYNDNGKQDKRPVLAYGKTWKKSGYTCTSRSTGLTCKRGSHGFFLSRESQRYF